MHSREGDEEGQGQGRAGLGFGFCEMKPSPFALTMERRSDGELHAYLCLPMSSYVSP